MCASSTKIDVFLNDNEIAVNEIAMRQQLLQVTQKLSAIGLNRGSSGNVSVREGDGFLVTPSGIAAEVMTADDMVWMNFAGHSVDSAPCVSTGLNKPSSEWRFHHDIYQARPEVNAVIHTHSMFATTLSTLRRDVPAFHYMIALAGGDSIRCAPYALFGSQALSNNALTALHNRKACLLANHGMIAIAENLAKALAITIEVETLCEQYLRALQVGEPFILSSQEMNEVLAQFKDYGSWNKLSS